MSGTSRQGRTIRRRFSGVTLAGALVLTGAMAHAASDPDPAKKSAAAAAPAEKAAPADKDAGAPPPPAVEPASISSNRPGFGETADVVGRGILQFESGMAFEGDRAGDAEARTVTAPAYLVRYGLTRRLELQVASEGLFSREVTMLGASERVTGRADVDLGFKAKVATEDEAGVNVAVLASVNMPTGADGFTSGGYDPGVKLALLKSLPGGFVTGGNVQLASVTSGDARVLQHALSAVVARGFAGSWSAFGEVYRVGNGPDVPVVSGFVGGIARVVGSNLQVDISVGRGLTDAAADWSVAFGVAVRRPGAFGRR